MKLVMDEKLKHRLVGLSVILSLGAIFAPAVVRKSGQRVENGVSVNVQLPPKPVAPNVAVSDEKDVFKTIKIARVKIPPVPKVDSSHELLKAEPITSAQVAQNTESQLAKIVSDIKPEPMTLALQQAANKTASKTVALASAKAVASKRVAAIPVKRKQPPAKTVRVASAAKPKAVAHAQTVYAVQVASFSNVINAKSLVNKLHAKGYKASYAKVGASFKVFAGHSPSKNDVVRTKTQLASSMQLNGFVVTTGVS